MEDKRQTLSNPFLPSDEITPAVLVQWFREIVIERDIPDDVADLILGFDAMQIQDIITCGTESITQSLLPVETLKLQPNCREICRHLSNIAVWLRGRICQWPGWIPTDPVGDLLLDYRRYNALKEGYKPDFDCRYATYYHRGVFFMYRSGHILMKFTFDTVGSGILQMDKCFRTAKLPDNSCLREILYGGYWSRKLTGIEPLKPGEEWQDGVAHVIDVWRECSFILSGNLENVLGIFRKYGEPVRRSDFFGDKGYVFLSREIEMDGKTLLQALNDCPDVTFASSAPVMCGAEGYREFCRSSIIPVTPVV